MEYMGQKDIAEIIEVCFRKPIEGEKVKSLNGSQMIQLIQREYPSVKNDHSTKVYLGLAMKDLGYEHSERGHVAFYKAVPLKIA